MDLYVEMGARFFMAMGVHHDNFDCWDSTYQPWNSVHVGPKVDIVGTWEKIARQHGLRFGIGFHNTPARTWGQFMPVRYTSDKAGQEGRSLRRAANDSGRQREMVGGHGPGRPLRASTQPTAKIRATSPFANQFMWRVDDAITKYHPDVIYFDEHAGDSQVDLGVHMGLGFLAPTLVANYYNKSLTWNQGKDGRGDEHEGRGRAVQQLPEQRRAGSLRRARAGQEHRGQHRSADQRLSLPDRDRYPGRHWHYKTGAGYTDAATLVATLMQNVSRNGSMLLNLTQHGRGNLDPQCIHIAKDIGAWLKVNGEAVYASRPFEVFGDEHQTVAYTRNNGNVYATLFDWNGGADHAPGAAVGRGHARERCPRSNCSAPTWR